MTQQLQRIVIVGGGAGGLELATRLGHSLGRKQLARIILIDAVLTHVWKPLLHEVATGAMDAEANAVNFRAHARLHGFEFQLGRMRTLNREQRQVLLEAIVDEQGQQVVAERAIGYDTLVIAVGSTANDFGTPGAQQHCLFLDSLQQARRFHRLLLNAFLHINYDPIGSHDGKLRIAIIGAGATGVELAAELRQSSQLLPIYGMQRINPEDVEITLIEAAERILPALSERLSAAAQRELERLGIRLALGQPVAAVQADGLLLKDGQHLAADIRVWAAGIKAPEFLTQLDGLATNKINQLIVNQDLSCPDDAHIFAFGDCASCPQPGSDKPVPPRAQAAHQQATTLATSLRQRLQGGSARPYLYQDYGSLISFSRYSSVGSLMGKLAGKSLFVEGRLARLVYLSLYRMHQLALHGALRTGLIWLSDRINKVLGPRLKLH
jgi:NADH dehydrogenase